MKAFHRYSGNIFLAVIAIALLIGGAEYGCKKLNDYDDAHQPRQTASRP